MSPVQSDYYKHHSDLGGDLNPVELRQSLNLRILFSRSRIWTDKHSRAQLGMS